MVKRIVATTSVIAVAVTIGWVVPKPIGKRQGPNPYVNLAELQPEAPDTEGDRGGAAQWLLEARLPQGATNIDTEWYRRAIADANRMEQFVSETGSRFGSVNAAAGAALGSWSELGPSNIGGRTRALLIHPTTPSIMYAAGVAGGVWKSTNAGASWTPLTDLGLPNLAVTNLVFDPTNPNTIYAGTGEGFFNSDATRGAGVFKSTDAGANWTQLAATATSDFYYVNKLVASPTNGQRLYAATRTGLFRSVDGGTSWAKIKDATAVNGCTDIAIQPNRAIAYAFGSCGTFATDGIYRFLDNNNAVTPSLVFTTANMGRTSLAISRSNPAVIYAMASAISGSFGNALLGVYRSTATGASGTWTTQVTTAGTPPAETTAAYQNMLLLQNPVYAYTACVGSSRQVLGQGWYDNVLAVDPTNSNVVYAGGIDLFRSDDGGANWGIMSYWYYPSNDAHYAHADNHVFAFHPQYNGTSNQTLYVGSDGGLFRTDNARAATASGFPDGNSTPAACSNNTGSVTWVNLNNGYNVTQFMHGLPYPDGNTYFGGTQDNGTLRGVALPWSSIAGGDGGWVAVDPGNTNVLFQEFTRLSLRKSTNGGGSFTNSFTGISGDTFPFYTVYRMDPGNSQRMWIGGTSMWRSVNQAASWTRGSPTITSGSITAMAISSADSNYVLAGAASGRTSYTSTGLTSTSSTGWTNGFSFTNGGGRVSWLEWQPGSTSVAYATSSTFGATAAATGLPAHVLKTTNGGASWTAIDGIAPNKIPDIPVWTIAVHPGDNNRLYVGTDLGVFTTVDGGLNWYKEVTGFANVPVFALSFDSSGRLYAFTHGRGAWRVTPNP